MSKDNLNTVLVTGAAGYIGTHMTLRLLTNGYNVIALDNFSNSTKASLNRICELTRKKINIYNADIRDKKALDTIFSSNNISSVIHFAALKSVNESKIIPLAYYDNNVNGTINVLLSMQKHNVSNFIFSSSATVYGSQAETPYLESMKLGKPTSPYGQSKLIIENILESYSTNNDIFRCISLRYFNPIGAHKSGQIGEDPKGTPNNLMPFITQVASGKLKKLKIFGNDYDTADGTCRRDYIHVEDLVDGHIAALNWLEENIHFSGKEVFNLGTGMPVSVLEIVNKFVEVTNININYEIESRREGDLSEFWANPSKANRMLQWKCKRTLEDMIYDSWKWQKNNPNGYK